MINKNLLLISFCLIMIFNACNNTDKTPTYEDKKKSMEAQEKNNPAKFLTINGTYYKNLLGKQVLKGNVVNAASLIKYKDIVLKISFFKNADNTDMKDKSKKDEGKNLISTGNFVIYDSFPPNSTTDFKLKVDAPSGTKTLSWEVVSATTE